MTKNTYLVIVFLLLSLLPGFSLADDSMAKSGQMTDASVPAAVNNKTDEKTDSKVPPTEKKENQPGTIQSSVDLDTDENKAAEDEYNIKLKNLEEKVNQLKEKVFRSKARLLLLQETVLTGIIASAKVHIIQNNEMGYFFKIESVTYSLDGVPIFSKVDKDGELKRDFDILPTSNLVAGNHNLTALVVVRGSGHGFFSYLDGYKFKIRSTVSFLTEEGKVTRIKIIPFEKGNLSTELKDRPSVRFEVEMKPEIEPKAKL